MLSIISLIRVKQWVKNLFMFLPLFFSGQLMKWDMYQDLILGYFVFCFAASFIYVLNDIKDKDADELHPIKRLRPLPSGKLSVLQALIVAIALISFAIAASLFLPKNFIIVIFIYVLLNIFYIYMGKKISIVDVMLISIGFVLRVEAGGIITSVPLSQWIIIMVFLLALFLALAKRRDDLVLKSETGVDLRKVSKHYSLEYLNITLGVVSGVIIVSYLMYSLSPNVIERIGDDRIFYTTLFVIFGLLRYLQLTIINEESGSPTEIFLKDRFIQLAIIGWLASFYILVYQDYLFGELSRLFSSRH